MTGSQPEYAFEDMVEGLKLPFGAHQVSKEAVIEFASIYDAQPFHLDEEAGKASVLGGLAASGWHTAALVMRMIHDAYLGRSRVQGGPGVEFLRWKRPVLAGDTLSGVSTVIERRVLKSRPHLGLVRFYHEVVNQNDMVVCEMQNPVIFELRDQPQPGAAQ